MFTPAEHAFMARALELAARGLYTTQPNPRVGCVIAHGDECVGEGYHRQAGGPHAEVFALREAGERARGATAYVTLEPCAHHGRTPPCADALIAAGVARVVIAAEDPFDQVDGRGIARLRAAGIAVDLGLMRAGARDLNVGFFSRIERGRPFVRVKLAMSLDGRTALASGESKWITGQAARDDVQRWRARSSAILSGIGTVLADDPRLNVRLPGDEAFVAPTRVIIDADLRTPSSARVLDGNAPTLVVHGPGATVVDGCLGPTAGYLAIDTLDGRIDLAALLAELARREVNEVHVEAGATLCGALVAAGLADEILLYVAPVLLGDTGRPLLHLPPLDCLADARRMQMVEQMMLGADMRIRLRPGAA